VISTLHRGKSKRVCHVNLLKRYYGREEKLNPSINSDLITLEHSPAETVNDDSLSSVKESKNELSSHLSSEQNSELSLVMSEFADIFSGVPCKTTLSVHHIVLQPDTKQIQCTPYRLNPEKSDALKQELNKLLDLGIIEESSSPWASSIVMVPKPDGTLRLCTDFRKVNSVTVPDPFPLPRVEDLLDRVGKAKFLTKLDMTQGYWQVPLDDPSIPVSGFVTPFGHFQWRFMPFGLRNAPATFSRLLSKLLTGLEMFAVAYLDDVIIFSDSWEEHLKHIKLVFRTFKMLVSHLILKNVISLPLESTIWDITSGWVVYSHVLKRLKPC